ncbi:MAG: hypothetical protein JWQ81_5916 [Amycolatopsis sp.]|nr:hypothetical protein [Amycolatopsis sp.]
MVIVIVYLIVAVLIFGAGLVFKGPAWLLIVPVQPGAIDSDSVGQRPELMCSRGLPHRQCQVVSVHRSRVRCWQAFSFVCFGQEGEIRLGPVVSNNHVRTGAKRLQGHESLYWRNCAARMHRLHPLAPNFPQGIG